MSWIRSTMLTGAARRRVAALGVFALMAFSVQLMLAGPAAAAPYDGGFSPTIVGGRADLNGNAVVNGRDDSNAFYGDTHIIDGGLDCNAWTTPNDGALGDGLINASDNSTLVGVDGTPDGITINVVSGSTEKEISSRVLMLGSSSTTKMLMLMPVSNTFQL
jgi:hypothetical protein